MKQDRRDPCRWIDLSERGQDAVKIAVISFIRGVRRKRDNPVSKSQIYKWLSGTQREAIDNAIADLCMEGKILASPRTFWRSGRNNSHQSMYYEVR